MLDLDNTLGDRAAAVSAWLDEFVAAHGLDAETRTWIDGLDADGYAPRDEVFEQIRARLGLEASAAEQAGAPLEGAWMVGDSAVHDIAPAALLGLRTIWIRRRRVRQLDGVTPTHVVDAPAEIAALIS